jgi:hypothetical protein
MKFLVVQSLMRLVPVVDSITETTPSRACRLTFRNRASYIQDGHTATLQTPYFIYYFNKYPYLIF